MKTTIKIAAIAMIGMSLGIEAQEKIVTENGAKSDFIYKDGKIGIGSTTPELGISPDLSRKLYVNGGITLKGGAKLSYDPNYYVHAYTEFNGAIPEARFLNYGYYGHRWETRIGTAMVIMGNSNRVGIGTTSPSTKLDVNGEVKTNNGRLVLRDNSIEEWATNGDAQIAINYLGYNKGTSQFRDFSVYNGKAGRIIFVKGSTGNVAINGKLESKEIKVTNTPTADFVFEDNYNLPTLASIEEHIKEKKHLPEIAPAKEMEKNGVNIGNFQIQLLQKIEELTLYTIQQEKEIEQLRKENTEVKRLNEKLLDVYKRIELLENKK